MNEITVPCYHPYDFLLYSRAQYSNPFYVPVSAVFSHESGEEISKVPGFYTGDGRWIIRFMPTREGIWRGQTRSQEPELNGMELVAHSTPNENPFIHGRLSVDPDHAHRFMFEDGSSFILMGFECDWLFALHQSRPDAFREMVDLITERGFNYLVTNVYAHLGFSEPVPGWIFAPPRLYVFEGTNDQPDHAHPNLEFFSQFDDMMAYLHRKGIVVHLMLQVQNKQVNWPKRRSLEDDLYWRYVVSRYQGYSNVVWDVGKECFYLFEEMGSHNYTRERINLIRQTDAFKHLVTVHDSDSDTPAKDSPADEVCDFVSDQLHLADLKEYNREAVRRFRNGRKPYLNIEYGYEEGVEPIATYHYETTRPWQEILLWTWSLFLGGAYPCYYYTNTAWDLVKYEPEPPGWKRYRYLMDFLQTLDLTSMAPDNEFVDRGLCLVEPGQQYLILLPEGGDVRVSLTDLSLSSEVVYEWMDIYSGERGSGSKAAGKFYTIFVNPLSNRSHPCVLAVKATK